jgi:hypothetical protein
MDNELASRWRAACIAVEGAQGIEDADDALAAFAKEAQSRGSTRTEAVLLLTHALDNNAPWEALAYSFHLLRWPELLSALEDRRAAMTDRRQAIWGHLHGAFDADWADRDMFPSLTRKVS